MSKSNKQQLKKAIDEAQSYAEYKEACLALDELAGNNEWKATPQSTSYDFELIQSRLASMKKARADKDTGNLMSIISEGLHGNLGNIANVELYQVANIGTKYLIEEFIDEVCQSLDAIYNSDDDQLSLYEKKVFFDNTSQAYGQTALILSGAAGLGFFHGGLLKTLIENDLLPNLISGSSAGALFAALIGTRSKEQALAELTPENIHKDFENVFKLSLKSGHSLFDPTVLENTIIRLFDLMTFEQAYAKTGIEINISVSSLDPHQKSRLLNAVSSPNVIISTAVRASTAVPYGFPAVQLCAMRANGEVRPYIANRKFLDGSITLDTPTQQLARIYGVNHTIVSQTNPLVMPFLPRSEKSEHSTLSLASDYLKQSIRRTGVLGCDIVQKLVPTKTAKLAIQKTRSILEQSYLGDINIIPGRAFENLTSVFSNPTVDSIRRQMREAEKSLWPLMSRIDNTTKINRTIKLRQKMLKQQLMTQGSAHKKPE